LLKNTSLRTGKEGKKKTEWAKKRGKPRFRMRSSFQENGNGGQKGRARGLPTDGSAAVMRKRAREEGGETVHGSV